MVRCLAKGVIIMELDNLNTIQSFKLFFEKYSEHLFSVAYNHIGSDDAQDIVQEIFIEVWEKRKKIKVQSTWKAYLYSMLKYKIYRFIDKRNELDEKLKDALQEIAPTDEIISFENLYQLLDDSLNKLTPRTRLIFEKKYFENKKNQEIADELHISSESVKTHLKRGLKVMRLQMKDAIASFMFL